MKTNTSLRVVENNSFASKDFTIQASGKMFHMMISGLYSNKPQSITRELWSNAYDAHAMVGKTDVPFLVTFPTALNPTFSCRDFGAGIAHEDMEGFYTVLGHSTKEDTNKAVGKWGVGRMSPMSYTDTFSVVSRHKGMIAYYSVQLGPDGSPQLHVLAPPMPTTDEDGLEVSFPVKRQDISAFQNAAEVVSYGFAVPPRVTNSQEKQFKPVKKNFEGKGFYLYEDSRLNGAYAQMGCVLYPIPSQHVPRWMNVVYQFDIGDLEVTASREALSFGPNDPTAASIKKKAEAVEKEMWQLMQDKINAQPKLFDAAKVAPVFRRYLPASTPSFTYKGQEIPRYWDLSKYTNISLHCGYKGYRQKQVGWGIDHTLAVENNYTIYVQDTSNKEGSVRAAVRIGSKVDSYSYYLWVRADLSNPVHKAELDKLLNELGYPVVYVKDIPDPGSATRGSRAKVTVSRIHNGSLDKWDMGDDRFQKGGYYYPMTNNEYPSVVRTAAPFIKLKLNMDEVVLVPKTLWKKFEGNSKWQLLEPALKAAVEAEADNVRKTFGNRYNIYPLTNLRPFRDVAGPVGEFARKTEEPERSSYMGVSAYNWKDILVHYKLETFSDRGSEGEYNQLLDKYPLLRLYGGGGTHKMHKDFVDYINMIDYAAKE